MTSEKFRRTLSGRVTSNKANKTVTVLVERKIRHALYGKYITRSKKYCAHDDDNQFGIGDSVLIEECRPISRTKSWRVIKLLKNGSDKLE